MTTYRRVVLKLSGEALAGESGWGVEPTNLAQLADEVLSVHVLAEEQGLTMHVFDVAATGVMAAICQGAEIGTRISRG